MWTARPIYRKSKENVKIDAAADIENAKAKPHGMPIPQLTTQKSLKQTLKEVKLVHVRLLCKLKCADIVFRVI